MTSCDTLGERDGALGRRGAIRIPELSGIPRPRKFKRVDKTSIMSIPNYALFVLGNPLLDIQVRNGEKLLEKYDLKANDAILAEEKHIPM